MGKAFEGKTVWPENYWKELFKLFEELPLADQKAVLRNVAEKTAIEKQLNLEHMTDPSWWQLKENEYDAKAFEAEEENRVSDHLSFYQKARACASIFLTFSDNSNEREYVLYEAKYALDNNELLHKFVYEAITTSQK